MRKTEVDGDLYQFAKFIEKIHSIFVNEPRSYYEDLDIIINDAQVEGDKEKVQCWRIRNRTFLRWRRN